MQYRLTRICILCSRLDQPGGIERAIVNTANLLQQNGYKVSLLVLDENSNSFFPINENIDLYQEPLHFGITQKGNFLTRKLDLLRHTFRLEERLKEIKPDAVVSTEYPFTVAAFLAAENLDCKVFAWEHHQFHHLAKSWFWKKAQKQCYPKLEKVICLNPTESAFFEGIRCRTSVIPNFVNRDQKASLQSKTLLTIGWLSKTKGIDLVPAIAEIIFKKHPDWQWKIIGKGDEEEGLRLELEKRNLTNQVLVLTPATHDLSEEYLSSSLYVMLSRFEFFPMVLLEAMAHGIPCAAFDCPTGPRHIITNGEDGVLVAPNDIDAMANTTIDLIGNEDKRRRLGSVAYQNMGRFSPEKILPLWEQVFS